MKKNLLPSFLFLLFLGVPALINADDNVVYGDVNGDGIVSSVDVTIIYNILLNGGEPGVTTYTANGVEFKMVDVDGGTFNMGGTIEQGNDASNLEMPVHQVTLSDFSVGQTEVTQALWLAVMGTRPSEFTGDLNRPVECVTWSECQQFITKLNQITGKNFRMLTEAEWEYAARGGKKSQGYKYSGSNTLDDVAWYKTTATNYKTHPVAQKQSNELGLYDMSGNVNEWVSDCYNYGDTYPSEPQTNPTGPDSGYYHIIRGGDYYSTQYQCRVSYRNFESYKNGKIGFRIAISR